jgi:DNA-directed RNA polymerase subunit alpha
MSSSLLNNQDFTIQEQKLSETESIFTFYPLTESVATTLAVMLRRTLLRYCAGASIFGIRINNFPHEFVNIPGVKEKGLNIITNVQSLILKIDPNIFPDEEMVVLNLKVSKKGPVTAAEISCPSGVTIINQDQILFHIQKEGQLFEIDLFAKRSTGYKTADENAQEFQELGIIPTLSNYSPIKGNKIGFEIKDIEMLRGKDHFKMLELHIYTNGSINVRESVGIAAKILQNYISKIVEFTDVNNTTKDYKFTPNSSKNEHLIQKASEQISLETVLVFGDKQRRVINALNNAGIHTLKDLLDLINEKGLEGLEDIDKLGKNGIAKITGKLEELNLHQDYKKTKK